MANGSKNGAAQPVSEERMRVLGLIVGRVPWDVLVDFAEFLEQDRTGQFVLDMNQGRVIQWSLKRGGRVKVEVAREQLEQVQTPHYGQWRR